MQLIRRHGGLFGPCVLTLALGFLAYQAPFLLWIPQAALAAAVLIRWMERRSGLLAALALTAACALGLGLSMGPEAAWFPVGLALPILALGMVLDRRAVPFWPAVGALALSFAALSTTAVWAVGRLLGGRPVDTLSAALGAWLAQSPQRDEILLTAYRMGLARLTGEPMAFTWGSFQWLNPLHRQELTNSLLTTFETVFAAWLPAQIGAGCALGGVLAAALPRWEAARDPGCAAPPPAPALRAFWLPNHAVNQAKILVVALYILGAFSGGALYMARDMALAIFQAILAVQGVAALDGWMRKHGTSGVLRVLVVVLGLTVLRLIAFGVGLLDSVADIRRIRPPRERMFPRAEHPDDKEDEP